MSEKNKQPKKTGETRIPHDLYEALMKMPLTGNQRRCLDGVIRMTVGYNNRPSFQFKPEPFSKLVDILINVVNLPDAFE